MTHTPLPPASGTDLEEVWAKARAKNREAIEELATRIRAQTLRIAAQHVWKSEVEDLVQDVVLSILESISALNCPKSFDGFVWYRARAKASCIQSRRSHRSAETEQTEERARPALWTDLIENERLTILQACLEQLPAKLRSCVQRRYWNSESAREIASTLSLSHTSINDRLRAGLESLNRCLMAKGVFG